MSHPFTKMISFLKKEFSRKKSNRICLTHRQCTILFAILMFIFSAVFSLFTTLGYCHIEETFDILIKDLRLEQDRLDAMGVEKISSNKMVLLNSEDDVISVKFIFKSYMHFGWILLISSGLLIYGTAIRFPMLMLPWIVVSACIYMSILFSQMFIYYDPSGAFDYIHNTKIVVPILIFAVIYFSMWYGILLYYKTIKTRRCHQNPNPKPKTVSTQEGLIHTVNQPKVQDRKKNPV